LASFDNYSTVPHRVRAAQGVTVSTFFTAAFTYGISIATLRRARKELGVRTRKDKRIDGDWYLELPPEPKVQGQDDD
jgi:hypothetical protein